EHPCHPALKGIMHSLFERPIADPAPQPRPMPADRPAPLSTLHLRKGKEAESATCQSNDDITKKPGRKQREPDNLHCEREGEIEQPDQDRKDELQDSVYDECDSDKRNDNHVVEAA